MSGKGYKRKTYVVNQQLQFRMVATFLLSVLGALVLFTAIMLSYFGVKNYAGPNKYDEYIRIFTQVEVVDNDGNVLKNEDGSVQTTTKTMETNRWNIVVPPIVVNNVVIMLFVAVIGIFFSHRIAGPVYRMKADIEKVLAGDKDVRVVLRKSDKLQDLAESVNLLLEDLNKNRQG